MQDLFEASSLDPVHDKKRGSVFQNACVVDPGYGWMVQAPENPSFRLESNSRRLIIGRVPGGVGHLNRNATVEERVNRLVNAREGAHSNLAHDFVASNVIHWGRL